MSEGRHLKLSLNKGDNLSAYVIKSLHSGDKYRYISSNNKLTSDTFIGTYNFKFNISLSL